MTTKPSLGRNRPARSAAAEWERQWQQHWSKAGLPGYELPVGGPGGDEREFLTTLNTIQS